MGLKSFDYSHIIHWEFGGIGEPWATPPIEGKPNCECEHCAPLALSESLPCAACSVTAGGPAAPGHVRAQGRAWGSFGDKGNHRGGEEGLAQAGTGPSERHNLRTPFFLL